METWLKAARDQAAKIGDLAVPSWPKAHDWQCLVAGISRSGSYRLLLGLRQTLSRGRGFLLGGGGGVGVWSFGTLRPGEDIQKQAILLADDAAQKGKREVSFRPSYAGDLCRHLR